MITGSLALSLTLTVWQLATDQVLQENLEDTVNGARSRDAVELVFWMETPKEYLDFAKEQKAQIASENSDSVHSPDQRPRETSVGIAA